MYLEKFIKAIAETTQGARSLVRKIVFHSYFWPYMEQDAMSLPKNLSSELQLVRFVKYVGQNSKDGLAELERAQSSIPQDCHT